MLFFGFQETNVSNVWKEKKLRFLCLNTEGWNAALRVRFIVLVEACINPAVDDFQGHGFRRNMGAAAIEEVEK